MATVNESGGSAHFNIILDAKMNGSDAIIAAVSEINNKVKALHRAMNTTSFGHNLRDYWNSEKSSVEAVSRAYERFNSVRSEANASEFLKSFNSFEASGNDIQKLVDKYGSGLSKMRVEAEKMAPAVANAFQVDNLKEAFDAIKYFENSGIGTKGLFDKMLNSQDASQALSQIESLSQALANARREAQQWEIVSDEWEEKYNSLAKGSGFEKLEEELSRYKSAAEREKEEFSRFLSTQNLAEDDWFETGRFSNIFEDIQNGWITAKEAMVQFAETTPEYLSKDMIPSDLLDTSKFDEFASRFETVCNTLEESGSKIRSTIGNGVFKSVTDELSEAGAITEEQSAKFAAMAESGAGIESISKVISELVSASVEASGASSGIDTIYQSITKLIEATTQLGGIDISQLVSIKGIYNSIANMRGISISEKTMTNLANGLTELSRIPNPGNLSLITSMSLEGFSNKKISKASLSNLTEYLPKLAEIDTSKIQNLADIKFDNLANLKIPKGNLTGIEDLAKASQALSTLSTNTQLDAIKSAVESVTTSLDKLGEKLTETKGKGAGGGGESGLKLLSEDAGAYNTALTKVNNTLTTAYANQKKWTTAENGTSSGDFQRYSDEINRLETLKSELGDKTRSEFSSTFKDISAGLSEAVNQMEAAGERIRLPEELVPDTKKYSDAIIKVNSEIAKMQNNLNSWSEIDGFNDANKTNIEAYKNALQEIENLKNRVLGGGNGVTDVSFATELSNAKANVSEITPELERAAKAYKELSSTSSTGKVSLPKELVADTKEYNNAIAKVNTEIAKMENNLSSWSKIDGFNDANKTSIAQYEAELNKLKELKKQILSPSDTVTDKSFAQDMSAVKASVSGITPELERAAKATKELQSSSFKPFTEGMDGYRTMMADIENQINTIKTKVTDASNQNARLFGPEGNAEFTNRIKEYEEYISKLEELQNKLKAGTKEDGITKGAATEELRLLKQQAEESAKALDDMYSSLYGSKTIGKEGYGINELKQAEDTLAQMELNLRKWSAAKNGKSQDSYTVYAEQTAALRELIAEADNGSMSIDDFNKRLAEIKTNGQGAADTIKANGENIGSFSSQLSGMIQRFSFYFSMTRMVMMTIQKLKEMVKASMEIETAMARIQIVTGATDTQMTSFFESASNQAQELGKNITDVAKSIETFSRLGYSLSDATQLSKYANIMSNVGDTTVENATTGITSIIKGYGLNPSDAEHVSDVLINIGQKYAISAEELMEAFQRGGAALAASGTSFEESAALFAATNASLQNAATTGTLWKTVSARIRSAKTELEELGEDTTDLADGFSKYREELKALTGVDIMEDEDHYKSMLTIFNELAAVWDDLRSDEARSRVAEILGGTRNLSGVMSTIQNIKDAQNAYNDALNSTGVSMEANNIYMETTEAHVGQLKASFQELSVDVFNSDFMKGFVDSARGAVEIIDTLIEKFGVVGTVAAGALGGMGIAKGVSALKLAFEGVGAAISGPWVAGILGAVAAISLAVKAYNDYNKQFTYEGKLEKASESAQKFKESTDELKSIDAEIESVRAKIEEINSIGGISINKEGELANLQSTLESLEIEKALLEEINELNRQQALSDASNFLGTESSYETGKIVTKTLGSGQEYGVRETKEGTPLDKALDYQERINKATEERTQLLNDINKSKNGEKKLDEATIKNYQQRADALKNELSFLTGEQKKTLEDIRTNYASLFDENGKVYDGYQKYVDDVNNFYKELKGMGSAYTEQTQLDSFITNVSNRLSSNASRAVDSYKKIKDEFDKLGVDESKTSFGNIDLNNRQALKWTSSNIEKYKDALESWGISANEVKDSVSTVLGMSNEFDGLEIAFSPMLQTDKGAVLLDEGTVTEYIRAIMSRANEKAKEDGKEGWTTEDLFAIDKEGIEVDGTRISGLIADVGESAIKTGEAMHYLGKDGAIAMEKLSADSAKALSTMSADKFANIFKLDKMKGGFGDKNLLDFSDSIAGTSEMSSVINSIVQEALELGLISDTSESSVRGLAESLEEAGAIGQESAEGLTDFAEAAEESTDAMEALNKYNDAYTSAMSASTSATGLNTQQIKDLTDAYSHLDGFDPSRLFEKTAQGIHLNEEYLKNLNAQIENEKMTELWDKLKTQTEERDKLLSDGGDTSKIDAEIESTRQLIAQYEGLTSAYNKWQTAKSGSNERDIYGSVGSSYDEMKKILDAGWYGDESLNAYLDMLLSAEQRTGDAYDDFQKLDQKIEGTSHSLMDYWQFDDDNNLVSDGVFSFLKDVNKVFGDTYSKINEDGTYTWDLTGNKLQEVADRFGTTTEVVEMFERALIDTGAAVVLDSQNIDTMQQQLQKLQQNEQLSSSIDLDFKASEMSLDDIKSKIQELNKEKIRIEAEGGDQSIINQIDTMMAALQNQTVAIKINAELNKEGGKSIEELLSMDDTSLKATLEIDDSEVAVAREALKSLEAGVEAPVTIKIDEGQFAQLMGLGGEETMTVKAELDSSEPDAYKPEDKEATVKFKKDSIEPDSYQPSNKSATVVYSADTSGLPNTLPTITRTVNYVATGAVGPGKAYGTLSVARANGTAYNAPWNFKSAYANGKVSLSRDEIALVNELGTESIIRNGQWMLIPGGMHQEALKKGDIILSAAQTKALIETGRADGHGRALALGTLISSAYGAGVHARPRQNSSSTHGASGSKSSSSRSSSRSSSSRSSSSSSSSNGAKQAAEAKEAAENLVDWIEVAISRIQRSVTNFTTKSSRIFSILTDRLTAADGAISKVNKEMEIQRKGAERYLKQANSVGLSADLAKKVQDGTIDINNYDEATKKLIDDYKQWYEKALECKDAVLELSDTLGELYSDKFNTVQTAYDNRIELLNHMITTYDNAMDDLEARGYLALAEYYKRQKSVQQEILKRQQTELNRLITQMSNAVNSGAVKVNSEAWYDMQDGINACKEAIQETNTAIIELGNSYRNVLWERFEYTQELISNITDETEFLIKLMSNTDLYDEMGQLTETGLSTMGMHGQNYNTYMYQADKYAEEIRKINKELAKDPYNTILIDKREEYLKAQRESILNAEDEKQAIVDLVEDGIDKELDSLKKLIDTYNESLDSAKNLYDYQKKIKEQTGDIAKLRKQLAAYQNDTSEENRARVQKLNADLNDALEKLEESEYEHQISEQKKLLDDMYNEYEEILNKRLDNIDLLISDMIEKVNDNSKLISQTISDEASDVGYTITEALTEVWSADGGMISIITMYGDKFVSIGTSLNTVLNGIEAYITKSAGVSNALSKDVIKNNTQETKAVKKSTSSGASKSKSTKTSKTGKSGVVTPNMPSNSQLLNMYQSASAGSKVIRKLANGNLVATDYKEQNGFLHVHVINTKEDFWGWVQKSMVKAHARGARHISSDETAWIDENGNELVLRPTENAMLTRLKAGDAVLNAKATDNIFDFGNNPRDFLSNLGFESASNALKYGHAVSRSVDVGGISINIPIEHVEDYNDFVNQMRSDPKFEKFIQSMTVDRLVGGSKLSKNKYKW